MLLVGKGEGLLPAIFLHLATPQMAIGVVGSGVSGQRRKHKRKGRFAQPNSYILLPQEIVQLWNMHQRYLIGQRF